MDRKYCRRSTADRIVGERNEREKAKEEIYCAVKFPELKHPQSDA
jgi:hypothetical protein